MTSTASPSSSPSWPLFPLGFVGGALALVRGFGFLFRTPRAWPLAAVPAVVLGVLFVSGTVVAIRFGTPAVTGFLPTPGPGWGTALLAAARFGVSVLLVVAAAIVAAWLTPPLSGPALERIILLRERDLGLPERPPVAFLTELWCGLRAQLIGLLVGAPVLGALWLLTVLFPPLALVTVPLKLLVVALLVAWGLLDYPLSLRGMRLRDRLALLRSGGPTVMGFAVAVLLLFAIPLAPILLLPAGVAAAAEIAALLRARVEAADRSA